MDQYIKKLRIICTCMFQKFSSLLAVFLNFTATRLMVKNVKMGLSHSRMLHISWDLRQPITPLGGYRLVYEYRPLAGGTAFLNNVIKVHFLQQSCQVGPIPSQTLCNFILFAIFNEASLDPGLKFYFKAENNQE